MAVGPFHRCIWGADEYARLAAAGANTQALAALNAGWCARFTAPDTRDVKTVYLNWSTVTTPGTVAVRVETIDATTGKPSGSLYDPSAALSITPVAGWQACTFATLPTAGLVAGAEYAVVLLTTGAGTAHTLRSHVAAGSYPTVVLTATDGTTRANFAEVTNATPVLTLVMEDNVEEVLSLCSYGTAAAYNVFGTQAAALKFTIPAGTVFSVAGVELTAPTKNGTPAGDLRVRIFSSADAAVSGTTITVDKDSLLTGLAAVRRVRLAFAAPVTLSAGVYRLVLDSAGSANNSNSWSLRGGQVRVSGLAPSGFLGSTTTDITAGPITWTDTATDVPAAGLLLSNVTVAAGGGGVSRSRVVNVGG